MPLEDPKAWEKGGTNESQVTIMLVFVVEEETLPTKGGRGMNEVSPIQVSVVLVSFAVDKATKPKLLTLQPSSVLVIDFVSQTI